jgi:peptide methionine sulfoxide reductase msrA/msrB
MIPPFQKLDGVIEVVAGYTGGQKEDPTYKEVSTGTTGHFEAVRVTYDSAKIKYPQLLDTFWKQIDPTDEFGQFADKGSQYKTAIFYYDKEQKKLAEESKDKLEKSGKFGKKIMTKILEATTFYLAEEYHQDYHKKHPIHYKLYKKGSGREKFIKDVWGK